MKTCFYALLLGALGLCGTTLSAQNGAEILYDDFEFIANVGCGDYAVSGTVKRILTHQGTVVIYEGTATELATGDTVPLHVEEVAHGNLNGFTSQLIVVFPSKVTMHSLMHLNVAGDQLHVFAKTRANCH